MTHPHEPDADALIDEMARASGSALRRPAPADGVSRAQRSKRTKQTTRLALACTAVLAFGVVGVAALGGNDSKRVGPTDTVVPTVTNSLPPSSTLGPSTTDDPPIAGAPEVVYGGGSAVDLEGVQQLFDPADGSDAGSEPIDPDQSRQEQDARYGRGNLRAEQVDDPARPGGLVSRFTVGAVTYEHEVLPSEITSLDAQDPAALPRFDRCGQSELVVGGTQNSVLPERIIEVSIGADGRYLVVLSAVCPEAGTLTDGYATQPYDVTLQVFDAANPGQPGRTLLTESIFDCQCDLTGFSFDGRFAALRSFNVGPFFRIFDLDLGIEVQVDQSGCEQHFTAFADVFGPWVGATSLAFVLDCDGNRQLLIRDVAPGGSELRMELTTTDLPTVEIDVAHFDSPASAWFTVCSVATSTCWLGRGTDPLIELSGVSTASFVPLGFRYGG